MKQCPQCGAPLTGDERFCENCGYNMAAANAAPPRPNNPTPPKQSHDSSGKTALIAVLGLLLLAVLGGIGWGFYTGKLHFGGNTSAQIEENNTEPTSSDASETASMPDVSEAVPVPAAEMTDSVAAPEVPTPSTPEVYMGLWGSIGDSEQVDFEMDGTTGWYSYQRQGVTGPKRTLKLKSYNKKTGRCVIDAYLKGKYIGCFDGKFIEDEVDMGGGETKVVQSYGGVFTSVKGVKVDFYLYMD